MTQLTFADLPKDLAQPKSARAVIVPVPLEKTTTYLKGTSKGPKAIIKASEQLEIFDGAIGFQTGRVGIHTDKNIDCRGSIEQCVTKIKDRAFKWFSDGKFPIFLGGEHSMSIGVFKALKEIFGPISILQIDAHADLRENYENHPFNHACVMSRAREYGHKLVQVGIRALSEKEHWKTQKDPHIKTFFDFDSSWKTKTFSKVIDYLKSPVYLTIDVDGLDSSLMPATGTPVPGGLTWQEIDRLLKNLFKQHDVIGADINEFMPSKSLPHCDFICAQLAYRILGYKAKKTKWPLQGELIDEE